MPTVRLTIPGQYWDTQLYQGRLYLFDRDGGILTLNWDKLIDLMPTDDNHRLSLICAFKRSDYLYKVAATGILRDEEIRALLNERFSFLAKHPLEVDKNQIQRASSGQQDNKFPFPHTDSTIYYNRLYVTSQSGIFEATCDGSTDPPVSTNIEELWGGPGLALGAAYGSLAIAAGEEGLWEYALRGEFGWLNMYKENPRCITQQHCSESQWAFHSIYGSSFNGSGVLASYEKDESNSEGHKYRKFDKLVSDQEIFSDFEEQDSEMKGPAVYYSWAAQDKICQATNGIIRVAKYQPYSKKEIPIKRFGSLELGDYYGEVVSAKVALFGTIIECDSGLIVLTSDEGRYFIPGEAVSWRVFPRSRHYENHLHIIYDDRLEVHSFNHDYLVNQHKKKSGLRISSYTVKNASPPDL